MRKISINRILIILIAILIPSGSDGQIRGVPYIYNVMPDLENWSLATHYSFTDKLENLNTDHQEKGILAWYLRRRIHKNLTGSFHAGVSFGENRISHYGISVDYKIHDPRLWTLSTLGYYNWSSKPFHNNNLDNSNGNELSLGIASDWSPISTYPFAKIYIVPRWTYRISKIQDMSQGQHGVELSIGLALHLAGFGLTFAYDIDHFQDSDNTNITVPSGRQGRFGMSVLTNF